MINIAICDDEVGTCNELENMVLFFAKSHAIKFETEVFYSGEALYCAIQENYKFDLIFLDIQLLELDGVQVGKQIREELKNENISIVYISSNETYAMSLFQVRPLDFLIKPITKERLFDTLATFIRLDKAKKNVFFFHVGKSICKLYLSEISYFACNGKKIEVHTKAGITEFYGNMQEVVKQVLDKGFWIIHKSYVVNTVFVRVYHYDSLELIDGTILPISQKYRKKIKECLTELYRKG